METADINDILEPDIEEGNGRAPMNGKSKTNDAPSLYSAPSVADDRRSVARHSSHVWVTCTNCECRYPSKTFYCPACDAPNKTEGFRAILFAMVEILERTDAC